MKILITGASGFIGRGLVLESKRRGIPTRSVFRTLEDARFCDDAVIVPDIGANVDWRTSLANVSVVVYAAGCTNARQKERIDAAHNYERVNAHGAYNLARQAREAGVQRFIYLSSIKVNGEVTKNGQAFSPDDQPSPKDDYGMSKALAEKKLRELESEGKMEITIIRPPLVYGKGATGNFHSLAKLVKMGVPLPLGAITENRRSIVALENLIDLIILCAQHPNAGNKTFLVSDGEDLSTKDLIERIGLAANRKALLFNVPQPLLRALFLLTCNKSLSSRLLKSLNVDINQTRSDLNWRPPVSLSDALKRALDQ